MSETGKPFSVRRRAVAPLAFSILIIGAGVWARSPIIDALTRSDVPGTRLGRSAWYVVIAPLSNVFDALTLLSLPQLFSAFAFVGIVALALRIRATRSRKRRLLPRFRVRDHLRFALNVAGGIVAISGLALLMPRPMARLRMGDPDLVAIDFHSHTSASHDGRPGFTPEANREWHRRAGFDVAYVTDHHTFAGARAAMAANPRVAAEGTVLLPGLEYLDGDEHVLAIGLDPETTDPEPREWHPIYAAASAKPGKRPTPALLILAVPGNLSVIPASESLGIVRLAAIEISDGSPKGIAQSARDYGAIVSDAKRLGISVVSGSDNHGWGRAALGWSVMRIPGWRAMSPEQLDTAIRSAILTRGAGAVQVMSRRLPPAASPLAVAMTGPDLALEIVRDIGWQQRVFFLFWLWFGWALIVLVERRRLARHVQLHWSLPEIIPAGGVDSLAVPE